MNTTLIIAISTCLFVFFPLSQTVQGVGETYRQWWQSSLPYLVVACRKRQRVRGGHWHSQRIHSSKLRLSQQTQNWVCTQLDGAVDQHANQWEEWSAWCRQRGERPRMASSLSHTRRCVAAIGFGAAPHYNLITIHLLWQDCAKRRRGWFPLKTEDKTCWCTTQAFYFPPRTTLFALYFWAGARLHKCGGVY